MSSCIILIKILIISCKERTLVPAINVNDNETADVNSEAVKVNLEIDSDND